MFTSGFYGLYNLHFIIGAITTTNKLSFKNTPDLSKYYQTLGKAE
jgi:hypothetical protein